ncbi:MAG: translation initiation factor IF-3 [Spirochaetales bacterium]|jgi:translation initiation factor IF-3|nr:translation initiation factor IF-3 [Spirochaetales bacterium]
MSTKEKDFRVNETIRVKEVRLIGGDGEQKVVSISEALQLAREANLDLVEVAPNSVPPVCKIMDFGKFKFEQEKKLRESKKNQKITQLKEIRMQPKIEKHDMEFKVKHIKEFLEEGDKIKVTIRFRGREMAHPELGRNVLEKVLELLEGVFVVESPTKMEGRFMSVTIAPKAKKQ